MFHGLSYVANAKEYRAGTIGPFSGRYFYLLLLTEEDPQEFSDTLLRLPLIPEFPPNPLPFIHPVRGELPYPLYQRGVVQVALIQSVTRQVLLVRILFPMVIRFEVRSPGLYLAS